MKQIYMVSLCVALLTAPALAGASKEQLATQYLEQTQMLAKLSDTTLNELRGVIFDIYMRKDPITAQEHADI
ncbi:hypothetical protein PsAD2_03075 [Pseudovibrio axinellae]|uniref:Uncharacterized protein n=1 Tax=Pseudovibrio axinellae TaxID=989403 RepID=A0A165XIK9_9HYPH|nr:hypothetical protein [Pseudovibrio axinellae]KZL17737.1 hypothetical protein PsAD2_03075 [Pseudovibrio axinellae]SER41789.1 hypothetical protein SAMN05421798_1106 [Pseudovibrio axinellae]